VSEEHPFHPLADQYPLMSEAELDRLAGRIKRFGQRLPIIRQAGTGLILDGRNRYLACLRAGVDPWYEDTDYPDKHLADWVEDANEHRRHLSPEFLARKAQERRERVRDGRRRGESLRALAGREGVSVSQVQRDLGDRQGAPPGAPAGGGAPADARGEPVPEGLRDVFADRTFTSVHQELSTFLARLQGGAFLDLLAGSPALSAFLHVEAMERDLADAAKALRRAVALVAAAAPYAACPRCGGAGGDCTDCRCAGWVPLWRHLELAEGPKPKGEE
jgi:hypothetical protein